MKKRTMHRYNTAASALRLLTLILVGPLLLLTVDAGESRIIKDKGIEIEAFVFGEGRETLIIAAGNGRPAADLEELAKGIAKGGIRVVTYNYRTIGASKGSIDGLTLHDYAQDVWRIADALDAKKVHLAGKTYGNRVMRTASADRPERTLSVTLIGAGGEILPSPEIQTKYKRYVDPKTPKGEWLELQAELMFAPGNEHLAKRSAKSGKYPKLASAQVKASNATPKREWIAAGTAPMLILTGLQDLVAVPENGLKLAKERPDTWLVGIPNCGHNMVFEQPDELTRLITDYIESVMARKTSKLGQEQVENLVRRSYQYVAMYNVNNKFALKQDGWNTVSVRTEFKDETERSARCSLPGAKFSSACSFSHSSFGVLGSM
jgi:pimeloyl-ACP methyl ester carboxylesterase